MDRKNRNRYGNFLVASWVLLLALCIPVPAQNEDLFESADTSYFKSGADDWNLVESVIRADHANVLLLLKRGADPDAKADGGMTALMFAAESGDLLLLKVLVLNGANLELTHVENTTPLLVAILNNHFEAASYLLEKGAQPDQKDDYQGSALIYASASNAYQIADLLLFYGATDTIKDRDGNDALITSVFFGNVETADVLLQNGLDPEVRDKKGNTPLMIAAQQGDTTMMNLLMEYGAELNAVNKKNYPPLAHAIQFNQSDAAKLLIDSGAHIHHLITPGRNLYDLAIQLNQKEIQRLLKERGAAQVNRPDFSELDFSWGNSLGKNEYMMQTRISWVDRKFGFFAETGFDFRLYPQKVQVIAGDNLVHQYREKRAVWAHGAGKYFRLFRDPTGIEFGGYAGLTGLLTFPRYMGIRDNPTPEYNLAPSGGFFVRGKYAGLKIGAERYTFGTLHEGKWKLNLTLFARISTQNQSNEAKKIYFAMASELKKCGININFAPVVDLISPNPQKSIISQYHRSFSEKADVVIKYSSAFIDAHKKANVLTTIKHFPGHGYAEGDTHEGFVDATSTFSFDELLPFQILIRNKKVSALMTAHVKNKYLDDALVPATLSYPIITKFLRNERGYNKVIITDDLNMGAIRENFSLKKSAIDAIVAGCDILLFSNNLSAEAIEPQTIINTVLDALKENKIT